MLVVDASVVAPALVDGSGDGALAREVLRGGDLHAPGLLDVEVLSVLRRHALAGRLTEDQATSALEDLVALPVRRWGHDVLLPAAWRLRHEVTADGSQYVATAQLLDCPLVTADARLARVRHLPCEVRLLR